METVIILSRWEKEIAWNTAKRRTKNNRDRGIPDENISGRDTVTQDYYSFCGELAFCKLLNIYPDLEVLDRNKHDARHNGHCYDIKTILDPGHNLVVRRNKKHKPSERYALMLRETEEAYRFIGWATADEVFNRELFEHMAQPAYLVQKDELHGSEEFKVTI